MFYRRSSVVVTDGQSVAQERTALLVGESDTATGALAVNTIGGLENPNEGQDGEGESGPVNEAEIVWGQTEFQSE